MNCINCGGPLTGHLCNYCGTDNSTKDNDSFQDEANQQKKLTISKIKEQINAMSKLPINEDTKQRKIMALKNKILKINNS